MKNPLYRMARGGEISWLSYYFAEFVARRADLPIDDLAGLSAALVCEANLRGDVCIRLDEFTSTPVWQSATVDRGEFDVPGDAAAWRARLADCASVGAPDENTPLTLDRDRLYLNRYWRYESRVALKILALLEQRGALDSSLIEQRAGALFGREDRVDADQMRAVTRAARYPFCVISGGPGTGKTTTVVRILLTLKALQPDLRIALAAPTGRAAARMLESIHGGIARLDVDAGLAESLPDAATTLHRLLAYRRGHYEYGPAHRLPCDCVVIDEASMVDLELMYHLLEALPDRARLILLGDRDQLASVSAGNVLGDITGHGLDPGRSEAPIADALVLLRQSYRFASGGGIGLLAARVNAGMAEQALALLRDGDEEIGWYSQVTDALAPAALEWIIESCQPVLEATDVAAALDAHAASRVLAATNRGELGVNALNALISTRLLAQNGKPDATLYHGLPIMVLRNQYELGVFNGDTGILWQNDGELRAWFRDAENGLRGVALNRLVEYAPAWVSTVHKAQGAEYDEVMLVLPALDDSEALSRELVYTAITRARRRFLLHASPAVANAAIGRLSRRHSGLAERLGWPPIAAGKGPETA